MRNSKSLSAIRAQFKPVLGLACLVSTVVLAGLSSQAYAYHYPWDQGHDTTTPNENSDGTGPCEGELCDPEPDCNGENASQRSPIYVSTGHFFWRDVDVSLPGRAGITLRRAYNSHDPRDGLFGNGWSSSCEASVYKTTAEDKDAEGSRTSKTLYQLLLPNGKRYTYEVQEDGSIQTPRHRYDTLEPQPDGTVKLTMPSGAYRLFASSGELLSYVSRNGIARHYRYDSNNQLIRLEDDGGHFLDFLYNASGRVSEVKDYTGRRWLYDYDTEGNLVAVTDPLNGTRTYQYQTYTNPGDNEVYHQLTKVVDASGVVETAISYSGSRAISYTEGSNKYGYAYYPGSRTVRKVDNAGTVKEFIYNEDQIVIEDRIQTSDGTWRSTRYEFDEDGNKTKIIDTDAEEWLRSYDSQGRLLSSTNPLGETTTYSYDGNKPWPITVVSPSGRLTSYTYDAQGNPVTITDAMENETHLSWSGLGDLLQVIDPLGRTMTMAYNNLGQIISLTDAENRSTTFQYDALGRRTVTTQPNGDAQHWSYDAMGRPITQINGVGDQVHFQYGPAGRLTQLIDGEGNPLTFEYDTFGRLATELRANNQTLKFHYMADNALAAKTFPNNVVVNYRYDVEKRLIQIQLPDQRYDFSYTARGQLASVIGTNGTSNSYTYDAAGRRTTETQQGRQISMDYNLDGELEGLVVDSEIQTFTRNQRGQITGLNTPVGNYGFQYDDAGQLIGMIYPGGSAQYDYNQASQLIKQQLGDNVNTVFSYLYDQSGRLIQRDGEGADWFYNYDAAGQITGASHGDDSYSFQYDKSGNRLENGQQYDAFNVLQLSQEIAYSNDPNGNRTQKYNVETGEVVEYQYDALNRLAKVVIRSAAGQEAALTVAYQYDAFNRRVQKTVMDHNASLTSTIEYLWLGSLLAAEYKGGEIHPYARYRYANNFSPVSFSREGVHYTVHNDYLGSPKRITDSQGAMKWMAVLSPYGMAAANDDPDGDGVGLVFPLRYLGQYEDVETGLYYNVNRYYDPVIGRYITEDPLGLVGGINFYIYASNSPTYLTDRLGLEGGSSSPGLLQMLLPAHTAPFSKDPIGGSSQSQAEYANLANGLRSAALAAAAFPYEAGSGAMAGRAAGGICMAAARSADKEAIKKGAQAAACSLGLLALCSQGDFNKLRRAANDITNHQKITNSSRVRRETLNK